jgi:transcriptional regulator with XRE-family HTH domain
MGMGNEIRRLRLAKGWTLEKLEEESGVAVGTISALEKRDSSRSIYFPVLAKALGVTYEQLSGGEYMPDEFVTPAGGLFVAESEPRPDHLAGVNVGPRLLKNSPPLVVLEEHAEILRNLEDIPPSQRKPILDEIQRVAQRAREAAAHFAARSGSQQKPAEPAGQASPAKGQAETPLAQTEEGRARIARIRREAQERGKTSSKRRRG